MNPQPDLNEDLSAIAAHSSRGLRPRPLEAIIARGRRRRRRQRTAAALAVTAVALAGGTIAVRAAQPAERANLPVAAPAAPPSAPAGALTGTTPVTLRLADAQAGPVVAGADDDDRVLIDNGQTKQYPGEDNQARGRWLLRPTGATFTAAQAVARAGGEVCMAHHTDGSIRIRLCRAGDPAQQFSLAPTPDGQAYTLGWNGAPLRIGSGSALTVTGTGPGVRLRIGSAR